MARNHLITHGNTNPNLPEATRNKQRSIDDIDWANGISGSKKKNFEGKRKDKCNG